MFERDQFEDKLRKATSLNQLLNSPHESDSLHIAMPNTNYCQLCQDKFEDYHVHTNSRMHQLHMNNSEGALLVQQLCNDFQKHSSAQPLAPKHKSIRKERRRD